MAAQYLASHQEKIALTIKEAEPATARFTALADYEVKTECTV